MKIDVVFFSDKLPFIEVLDFLFRNPLGGVIENK